ncbi:hypothetical protein MtrunA17_Chr5g0394831 [Medicago truncatula]|uniref:Secreted protein n=1 Tax=Medicago truncatula TaxID=3880 RepID=A0A396HJ33_MEDTR|nr:hypothetical protein MtrunA17_Chr5g0394831 [Medicago truncatula]
MRILMLMFLYVFFSYFSAGTMQSQCYGPTPMSERTCNAIAHVTINNYKHKSRHHFPLIVTIYKLLTSI